MTTRERLPQRRSSTSFSFEHEGASYTASIGYYPDGRVGEIFLNGDKINSQTDVAVRDAAVLASIALQYNAPIKTLLHSLAHNPNGTPQSPLGKVLDMIVSCKV